MEELLALPDSKHNFYILREFVSNLKEGYCSKFKLVYQNLPYSNIIQMEAENTSLMYQAPVGAADGNFPLTFKMSMPNAELMLESRGMSSQERKRSEDNFHTPQICLCVVKLCSAV